MCINPVGFYSNLDYQSVYSDYKSVTSSYVSTPQPFVMDTRRNVPQLNNYIIYPNEKTREVVEIAREVVANYEQKQKEEKYKVQPKDFLYKSTPIWSRLDTAHKLAEQGDYLTALTVGSLALMFGPEDLREVSSAVRQIKSMIKGDNSFVADYDYTKAQHPGSFFRGSILHKNMNPFAPNSKFVKEKMWLLEQDKAWIDTKVGDKIRKIYNVDIEEHKTKIEEVIQLPADKNYTKAYQFIGKSNFGRLTARALTRTPVLGTVADAGIEGLQAIHDIKEGEKPVKAFLKALSRFVTSTILTLIGGTFGSLFGPIGTIAGVTITNYISSKIADAID